MFESFQGVCCTAISNPYTKDENLLREKCIALGIRVPQFKKMEAWSRRRLPPDPSKDGYIPLVQRYTDDNWHEKGRAPRVIPELNEDAHIMLRCLYRRLPLDIITKPTRSSSSENEFARKYGLKFAMFLIDQNAVKRVENNVLRACDEQILLVLRDWLSAKVNVVRNTFQWEGFTMTPGQITSTTADAFTEWLEAYM